MIVKNNYVPIYERKKIENKRFARKFLKQALMCVCLFFVFYGICQAIALLEGIIC